MDIRGCGLECLARGMDELAAIRLCLGVAAAIREGTEESPLFAGGSPP